MFVRTWWRDSSANLYGKILKFYSISLSEEISRSDKRDLLPLPRGVSGAARRERVPPTIKISEVTSFLSVQKHIKEKPDCLPTVRLFLLLHMLRLRTAQCSR
jgi:hypothetical protein